MSARWSATGAIAVAVIASFPAFAESPPPSRDPAFQSRSPVAPPAPAKSATASKPDYRFAAVPFSLSSWDSNDWAIEAKATGLVRGEGRRLILTFGDPVTLRRSDPAQRNPPTVVTSVQVLLVVESEGAFRTV